jgi:DNA polymerase-3 subunit epsilon
MLKPQSPVYGLSEDQETITIKRFSTPPWPKISDKTSGSIIAFLDVETTGLNYQNDKIIEIGLVRFLCDENGTITGILDEISGLEDPKFPLPEVITQITGITDEMLRDQKIDWVLVNKMLSECSLILAHNAGFDRPFIDKVCPASRQILWGCSMSQVAWSDYGHRSKSLEHLARDHGFFYTAHRALMDVYAAINLLQFPSPSGFETHLKEILMRAPKGDCMIKAKGAAFEKKDLLKAQSFRWNPEERVWFKNIPADESEALLLWLKEEIYQSSRMEPEVVILDAKNRFQAQNL